MGRAIRDEREARGVMPGVNVEAVWADRFAYVGKVPSCLVAQLAQIRIL